MKINEVEQQAGITKRNIRFYEQQGLLSPKRNGENGYRDYSEEDVAELKKIKLRNGEKDEKKDSSYFWRSFDRV